MQLIGRMIGIRDSKNIKRASAAIQTEPRLKTKGAPKWNDMFVHMVSTLAIANFQGSDCSILPFTPGNLIALSSVFCGLVGMLANRFLY